MNEVRSIAENARKVSSEITARVEEGTRLTDEADREVELHRGCCPENK